MTRYSKSRWWEILVAIALMWTGAASAPAATLTLHPSTPIVTPGTRIPLRAETPGPNPMPVANATWSVTAGTGSATISPEGILTGTTPGTINLTVTSGEDSGAALGYVVPSGETTVLSLPNQIAVADSTAKIPFILSSSPDLKDAAFTLRFTSADPNAPVLTPSGVQPADGVTLAGTGATPDGSFTFKLHWDTPSPGPMVLCNVLVPLPSGLGKDTTYQTLIPSAVLTPATGADIQPTVQPGQLLALVAQPGPVTRIEIQSPAEGENGYVGKTLRFVAVAFDSAGNRVSNAPIAWSTDTPSVGSIDPNTGVFKATTAGNASVHAVSGGIDQAAVLPVLSDLPPVPDSILLPSVNAAAGSTVEVPLLLGPIPHFGGLTLSVRAGADTGGSKLTFLFPETGPVAQGVLFDSNLQPDGALTVALLASHPLQIGTLIRFRFTVPADAPQGARYPITIEKLDISDDKGQTLQAAFLNGEVVIPDTSPPTVSITAPAGGALVNQTVSVTVNAEDNFGVVKAELLADGAVVATSTAAPFTMDWDTRTATEGAHSLKVRATDAAGNAAESAAVAVVVDNTAPVAAFSSPQANETVAGMVAVAGTASDANFLSYHLKFAPEVTPGSATEIGAGGTQPVSNGPLGTWDTSALPNADYLLTLMVEDQLHQITETTVKVTVNNLPDLKKGDANADGSVDVSDAVIVLKIVAQIIPTPTDDRLRAATDANSDGSITVGDAIKTLRIIAGLP